MASSTNEILRSGVAFFYHTSSPHRIVRSTRPHRSLLPYGNPMVYEVLDSSVGAQTSINVAIISEIGLQYATF
jgi:hypothetical protein